MLSRRALHNTNIIAIDASNRPKIKMLMKSEKSYIFQSVFSKNQDENFNYKIENTVSEKITTYQHKTLKQRRPEIFDQ